MTHAHQSLARAPLFIRYSGPITRRLLGFGVPMGPNNVLTVRGRLTGTLHSVPLAVLEFEGRRWVVGTFGDVNWCRNLRADPRAQLEFAGHTEDVDVVELSTAEASDFFAHTIPAYVARLPLLWRVLTRTLVRLAAPEVFRDPQLAARRRPVFELVRAAG